MIKIYFALCGLSLSVLTACTPVSFEPSNQHVKQTQRPATPPPEVIQAAPLPEPPSTYKQPDVFTVVVNNVAVKELLFALARDANVEIDINDSVSGFVTLNAIDNTFDQILGRINRQVPIRYSVANNIVRVEPDTAFLKHYEVSYVNMDRTSESAIAIATEVSSTGGTGSTSLGNISSTQIKNSSKHQFWKNLVINLGFILEQNKVAEAELVAKKKSVDNVADALADALGGAQAVEGGSEEGGEEEAGEKSNPNILVSPESGLVSVYATQKEHHVIQKYLDLVLTGAQRQVFIEATIVEVDLKDDFQAGVDWSKVVLAGQDGFSITQGLTGVNLAEAPVTTLQYNNTNSDYNIGAAVKLLSQFGDAKVLSTPKIMALNNQTALLKVVDNRIYFTVGVEEETTEFGIRRIFETTIKTLPVGLVMSVTPQISNDGEITLNVRPTISRILRFVPDPNPALGTTESFIPEVSVREIETILRVKNGDVAVIGGLMQDNRQENTDGVPVISKLPYIGGLFSYKNNKASKSELVIFLKPIVVEKPSLNGEFSNYKRFLENTSLEPEPEL